MVKMNIKEGEKMRTGLTYEVWEKNHNKAMLKMEWNVGDKTSIGKIEKEFILPSGDKQFLIKGGYYHEKVLTPPTRSYAYYENLARENFLSREKLNQIKHFLRDFVYRKDGVLPSFLKVAANFYEKVDVCGYIVLRPKNPWLVHNLKFALFRSQVYL